MTTLYNAYTILCPIHGHQSAAWKVEGPTLAKAKETAQLAWERQRNEVTIPGHHDCGDWDYVLKLCGGTRAAFDEHVKQTKALDTSPSLAPK